MFLCPAGRKPAHGKEPAGGEFPAAYVRRKNIQKIRRMKMSNIIKEIEAAELKQEVPQFETGDTVRVFGRIKEGARERVQVFEGTVLKIQGGGARTTFTVRKISGGVGVEKTWPLHSPNVEKVEVVRKGKVRRAKLNYLRNLSGKKAKVKEQMASGR
jgi:large subunit ribosomal protein L19